jgi:DNA-binding NarL/FixJ family response regulator
MRLLATGRTVDQVAVEMGVAPQTIKNHVTNAYKALRVKNRTEAYRALGWMR